MNNSVIHNTITGNGGFGIFLTDMNCFERCGADYNRILGNTFLDNNLGGPAQASDSSRNNHFAQNYWNDHDLTDLNQDGISDLPYVIPGSAHTQDSTPLINFPPENFTEMTSFACSSSKEVSIDSLSDSID